MQTEGKRGYTKRDFLRDTLTVGGIATSTFLTKEGIAKGIYALETYHTFQELKAEVEQEKVECLANKRKIIFRNGKVFQIIEGGDSVATGFYLNGWAPAPVSFFYGNAINSFIKANAAKYQGYSCYQDNVGQNGSLLDFVPNEFKYVNFKRPTTVIESDGGNHFLEDLQRWHQVLSKLTSGNFSETSSDDLKNIKKSLDITGEAVGDKYSDFLGMAIDRRVENIVIFSLPPIWKTSEIRLPNPSILSQDVPIQVRGNYLAEEFARLTVDIGNNHIVRAINNSIPILNQFGVNIVYEDITFIDSLEGIHPTPISQRAIAIDLLKKSYIEDDSLASAPVPNFEPYRIQ